MQTSSAAHQVMSSTREEENEDENGGEDNYSITKDDLQAMKDMIGDIKRNPSLLYRLSTLPGDNANGNGGANNAASKKKGGGGGAIVGGSKGAASATPTRGGYRSNASHNSSTGKIFVDDDATDDVSSLGMMSSSEYRDGSFYSSAGGGLDNKNSVGVIMRGGAPSPRGMMPTGPGGGHGYHHHHHQAKRQQGGEEWNMGAGGATGGMAGGAAGGRNRGKQGGHLAMQRSNHDAEIALRMQSLRAKRGLTQNQLYGSSGGRGGHQGSFNNKGSSTSLHQLNGSSANTSPTGSSSPHSPPPSQGGGGMAHAPTTGPSFPPSQGSAQGASSPSPVTTKPPSTNAAVALTPTMNFEGRGGGGDNNNGNNSSNGNSNHHHHHHHHQQQQQPSKGVSKGGSEKEEARTSQGVVGGEGGDVSNPPNDALVVYEEELVTQLSAITAEGDAVAQQQDVSGASGNSGSAARQLVVPPPGDMVRYSNYSVDYEHATAAEAATNYHSAVSKYVAPEDNSRRAVLMRGGGGELGDLGSKAKQSSKSKDTGGGRHAKHSTSPAMTAVTPSLKSTSSSSSKSRSRSALPRPRASSVSSGVEVGGGSKGRARGSSEQPKKRDDGRRTQQHGKQSSHRDGKGRHHKHRRHDSIGNRSGAPLDTAHQLESLRADQQHASHHDESVRKESDSTSDSFREQADKVTSLPALGGRPSASSFEIFDGADSDMHGYSAGRSSDHHHHQEGDEWHGPSLGRGLATLDRKSEKHRRNGGPGTAPPDYGVRSRHDVESDSVDGKSVLSRLSQLQKRVKRKSVHGGGSSLAQDGGGGDHHKAPDSLSGSENRSKGLVSRISHTIGSASPKVTGSRRRMASADYHDNSSDVFDYTSRTVSDQHYNISNDESESVTWGIELAMRSGQVPRLCDERGRCLFHPNMRLQKPKLFGGWKILFQHCPDCAVEHMKKTQEKLATMKKEKQRERAEREKRHRRKELKKKQKNKERREREKNSDPIIGTDVGDENFATEKKLSRKRGHHDKKKEKLKERLRGELVQSLAMSSPAILKVQKDEDYKEDAAANKSDHIDEKLQQQQQQQQQQNQPSERKVIEEAKSPTPDDSLAIIPKSKPTTKQVNGLPWSDYNGLSGRYTGEVNERYLPHGRGEMVYDKGIVSSGIWYDGVLDTEDDGNSVGGGTLINRRNSAETAESEVKYTPETLPNYCIGDKGRSADMIIAGKKETAAAVADVRKGDAAFVRRSDGSWTYAIVKDRAYDKNEVETIRFKVNVRGSTKAFPANQWGTYVRRIKKQRDAPAPNATSRNNGKGSSLADFLDSTIGSRNNILGSSNTLAGGNMIGDHAGDSISVTSAQSAPMMTDRKQNLTTGKMKIRTRSRSRSRNRKHVTTLPLLLSSSMSVSEENEGNDNGDWETASGSGYRLRGIDP